MRSVSYINARIVFDNGQSCEVSISAEGIQRWNGTKDVLGDAVDPTEAMRDALLEAGCFERDECDAATVGAAFAEAAGGAFATPAEIERRRDAAKFRGESN